MEILLGVAQLRLVNGVFRHALRHMLDYVLRSKPAPGLEFEAFNGPLMAFQSDVDQRLSAKERTRPKRAIPPKQVVDQIEFASVEFIDDIAVYVCNVSIAGNCPNRSVCLEMADRPFNGSRQ